MLFLVFGSPHHHTAMISSEAVCQASAIILAGGESSRMGTAKFSLPFNGEPLIAHLVRRLANHFNDVLVVAAPEQELPPFPRESRAMK